MRRKKTKQQFKAKKIASGLYQIGKLLVRRHDPETGDGRGLVTTWCRDDSQGGGVLSYSLREIVKLANTEPRSLAWALARGMAWV